MTIITPEGRQYGREQALGRVAQVKPTGLMEGWLAGWERFSQTESQWAPRDRMRDLVEERRATVQQLTGIDLEDPYLNMPSFLHGASLDGLEIDDDSLFGEINRAIDPVSMVFRAFDWKEGGNEYMRLKAHEDAINEARVMLPEDQWHLIPTIEQLREQMQANAREVEAHTDDVASRATLLGTLGYIAGSMGAAVAQPEVLMTLPIGAPVRVGLVARMGIEAAIGAGVETAIQPGVQSARDELGLESGLGQALENIAIAGAGSAALTGVLGGVIGLVRGGRGAFVKRFGREPTADEQAALDVTRQALETEAVNPYEQRSAAAARVYQANEEAATVAAIEGRAVADQELQTSEELTRRMVTQGASFRTFTNDDLNEIGVDAELMQFKGGGDEFGVTERLQGVREWDVTRAGVALVYEFADGRMLIADGHQRLGLAQRLAAEGQRIELPAIVLRELDGTTPQEARGIAAAKNIAEGTGTALDAARVMRDLGMGPEDLNLPPRSALVRDAEGLSNLSQDAFNMVINEIIPERFGAIIGRIINDPALQQNVAGLLAKLRPANVLEAEMIVRQAQSAGVSRGTQSTLFGDEDIAESLYLERARVLDRAMKMLRRDQATFSTLLDQEGAIAGAGNVLDQASNAARLEADRRVMAYIQAQANRKGPISDALNQAAREAKESGQYQAPARGFTAALSRAIEQGEVAGSSVRGDRIADELATEDTQRSFDPRPDQSRVIPDEQTVSMFDDPTGDGAVRQSDGIEYELRDQVEAEATGLTQPSVGQPVALRDLPRQQAKLVQDQFLFDAPARSLDDIYTTAQRNADNLNQVARTIGRRKGVTFKSTPIKSRATAAEKMARKNYRDPREITDIVRGGFIVETPSQADAVIATLGGRYSVLDEGWKVTPEGYFDRKVLVKFEDGTVGEVQIWHPDMLAAKDRRGHKLYSQVRRLAADDPRRPALEDQMRDLYLGVAERLDDQWRPVLDDFISGSAGGRLGNDSANASGARTAPDSATSSARAASQESDLRGTTQASDPTMMAGRPSQSTNEVLDIADPLDVEPGAEGLPQTLMPGVRPVNDADRMALDVDRPLDGGNRPMDMGLFGDEINQQDLLDLIGTGRLGQDGRLEAFEVPVGERIDADGNRVAEVQTVRQILDEIEEGEEFLSQIETCQPGASA